MHRDLFGQVLAHLRAGAPLEAVGLLAVADAPAPQIARAVRFYPGTNVDASPTRYTMDPVEVIAAFRDMEANGWRLGAIAHSHPATPAAPSATDLREAHYPAALTLIVSLTSDPPDARAWRIVPDETGGRRAVEAPLVIDDADATGEAWDAES